LQLQLHEIAFRHRDEYLAKVVLKGWASYVHRLKSEEELVAWQMLRKENMIKKSFFTVMIKEIAF